jgi:hypothetical protein
VRRPPTLSLIKPSRCRRGLRVVVRRFVSYASRRVVFLFKCLHGGLF